VAVRGGAAFQAEAMVRFETLASARIIAQHLIPGQEAEIIGLQTDDIPIALFPAVAAIALRRAARQIDIDLERHGPTVAGSMKCLLHAPTP